MWTYVKFLLGLFLLLGAFGSVMVASTGQLEESAQRIVENGTDTVGVIDKRTKTLTTMRFKRIGGFSNSYTIHFTFETLDGTKYGGTVDVTKEQALAASDGGPIRVRYNKLQPSIYSATEYENYMSSADTEDMPYGTFWFSALLFLLGGGWLVYSNGKRIAEAWGISMSRRPKHAFNAAQRLNLQSAGRGDGPMFGKR